MTQTVSPYKHGYFCGYCQKYVLWIDMVWLKSDSLQTPRCPKCHHKLRRDPHNKKAKNV